MLKFSVRLLTILLMLQDSRACYRHIEEEQLAAARQQSDVYFQAHTDTLLIIGILLTTNQTFRVCILEILLHSCKYLILLR